MDQYDVFENPNRDARGAFPFVVVLQSEVTRGQQTVIVAPLSPKVTAPPDRLTPSVEIGGREYAVLLQSMAAIRSNSLRTAVTRLDQLRETLPRAIDLLFLGF